MQLVSRKNEVKSRLLLNSEIRAGETSDRWTKLRIQKWRTPVSSKQNKNEPVA